MRNKRILALVLMMIFAVVLTGCLNNERDREDDKGDSIPNESGASVQMIVINAEELPFEIELEDNDTAQELLRRLPISIEMSELNNNEKYYYFDQPLPTSPKKVGRIKAGDIMLYGDNCLVVFYEGLDTTYSYTRIGTIKDITGLKSALGPGRVSVNFLVKRAELYHQACPIIVSYQAIVGAIRLETKYLSDNRLTAIIIT